MLAKGIDDALGAALAASPALQGCEIVNAAGNVDALRRLRLRTVLVKHTR